MAQAMSKNEAAKNAKRWKSTLIKYTAGMKEELLERGVVILNWHGGMSMKSLRDDLRKKMERKYSPHVLHHSISKDKAKAKY
jgi:hypothetical protein